MSSFDLETAIATWRHALALRRAFLKEDLDELERHLRDHTAELVSNGNNLETAFREASTMLGDFEEGEIEYRKVLMTKLWRHHAIADEARWRIALFANYFKIARRHLWAHRMYTSIMIVGLAIGLATCLIIALFVRHELSYDRHFSTANRVYRLHQTELASSIMGLAGTIENRFPEIEYATLVPRPWEYLLTYDDQKQYLEGVLRVDSTFLTVFPFKVVRGQGEQALHAPGRMLVTESTAKRLFGDEDPIGKTIWVETSEPCQIVGILADPPSNTHFSFNALLSLHEAGRKQRYEEELKWTRFVGSFLYLLLREGTDANSVEARIHDFEVASRAGEPEGAREAQLHLQPLTDIHLYASALNQDIAPQGDIENVYLFAVIGILILLIACVNYVNLATARSVGRAKEIGVRKVVGADRHRLIIQFLSESTLMACLAWPLTLVLAVCALPFINSVTGQSLPLLIAHDPVLLLQTAGITLVLGIFSGLYPAVALTQPKPAVVLVSRGRTPARRGKWVRRTLVVLQFSVASALVAVAMAIGNQLEYIRTKQLGYIPEHLISFNLDPAIVDHYDAFAAKLASLPAVVSATRGVPPGIGWRSMMVELADPESGERWPIDFIEGDHAYLETLGITLLQGRTFDPDRDDGHTVLLSRSTVERLGLQENPLGRYLPIKALKNPEVIGVFEDMNNASLRQATHTMAIGLRTQHIPLMLVRLRAGAISEGIEALSSVWNDFVSARPFKYSLVDDQIAAQYTSDKRLGRLFTLFSSIAIFIACLGLFGLASFSAEQRTKEIGIRKVLGAGVAQIAGLFTKEYTLLVLFAVLASTPIAYLAIQSWLDQFAYHIPVRPWLFLGTMAITLIIALASVIYQAILAALADPVESLRYE